MKTTKIENISPVQLDFFLKQNKEDVRVTLKPGESSWCDEGSTTKSMILYERKNLIKSSYVTQEVIEPVTKTVVIELVTVQAMSDIDLDNNGLQFYSETPLEKAQKETDEYKKESEKTYKGKKRGRKKKRGPKPGAKNRKNKDNPPSEI